MRGLILLLLIGFLLWRLIPNSLSHYTDAVWQRCKGSQFTPSCYDREIPRLMDPPKNLSMKETFSVLSQIQKTEPTLVSCHLLAHKIAGKAVRRDPTNWKYFLSDCPALCQYGCQHGVLISRYGGQILGQDQLAKVSKELAAACLPRPGYAPGRNEQYFCFHGLGHFAMFAAGGSMEGAVNFCQGVAGLSSAHYAQACTEGAFMSLYAPQADEEKAMVAGKTPNPDHVPNFCSGFLPDAQNVCRRESWPLFREMVYTPEGVTRFCSYAPDETEQKQCFETALNILAVYLNEGPRVALEKSFQFCSNFSDLPAQFCFQSAARRYYLRYPESVSDAVFFCKKAPEEKSVSACYTELIRVGTGVRRSADQLRDFCSLFPETLKANCLIQYEKNDAPARR